MALSRRLELKSPINIGFKMATEAL